VERGCLNEGTVVAFLQGGLAAAKRSVVEDHVASCSACAELVTWAAADEGNASRSAGREGRPFVGQLAPGSRVDRYQILGAVGRGGMGEVYAAYHPDLDRKIALKVVHESGVDSVERRSRLLREARAIARLSHPNVVSVHDAGTFDGRVYIAMEFIEGETVDSWLRSRPRNWREVVDVFIAAARGLASAHAAGIIHRDFKPQNVMIGRDGDVRVMDFGLARLAEEPPDHRDLGDASGQQQGPATVTKTGALVGTLAYMAPEQFRGEAIDARADQCSFCVALHEALFGSRPALAHVEGGEAQRVARRRLERTGRGSRPTVRIDG
jgi:serine/threonine protein kinase